LFTIIKKMPGKTIENPLTLYDKLWNSHVVRQETDGTALIYIDRHLVHEVTSPQAFEGLRLARRRPWRTSSIVATADHNTPTKNWQNGIDDPISLQQVKTLDDNISNYGSLAYFPFRDPYQGIVHVVGPEHGATLPGMSIVCGDSHTSTHGAFAAMAHGIGTSEVEHVLATQCLLQKKSKNMRLEFYGSAGRGFTAKDMALALIRKLGAAGGAGYAVEFGGQPVRALSMEGRMTLCNMAIEAGARLGLIAVDDTTIDYLQGRRFAPQGEMWKLAVATWRRLHTDQGARFDHEMSLDISRLPPQVSWGSSPEMVVGIDESIPQPGSEPELTKREGMERALEYMGLTPGTMVDKIKIDKVFIGSCTNSRIEDLRAAAVILKGRSIADNVRLALVVPGSGQVRRQAEAEGIDQIFKAAGFEWRQPGCSMCLAMNDDRLEAGERCASTSNRNFEGRQGAGGRTHLMSPIMASASAIAGHLADVRKLL